jgi:hypothetical protein
MQLLRDNLTLWTSDLQEDGGDQGAAAAGEVAPVAETEGKVAAS